MSWHLMFDFEAPNAEVAEGFAATLQNLVKEVVVTETTRHNASLSYDDPITGRVVVWADPIKSLEQLGRDR